MSAIQPTTPPERVSVVQVRGLIEALERSGLRGDDFLRSSEFDMGLLAPGDAWMPTAELDRLIELAIERTGDAAFGLHWGEQTSLLKYDLVTPLVATARTLRLALLAVVKYQRLLNERPSVAFEERGGAGVVLCVMEPPHRPARRARAEMSMVGMCRVLQYYCGAAGVARRIAFDHPAPEYAAEYTRILGPSVEFASRETALEFDAGLLDVPQVQYNSRIFETVEDEAARALSQIDRGHPHTERLRRYLTDSFPTLPDMDEAARQLGMASRSLRRRLAAEGASFHALFVEARVSGAIRLLQDPGCSIKEAAYRMGFANPSAFHRAFKRWTGMSPTEARRGEPRSRR